MRIKKQTLANLSCASSVGASNSNNYEKARKLIKESIDTLGTLASSGDAVAKDAIANLSVIYFSLSDEEPTQK